METIADALEAEAACVWHDWAGALLAAVAGCVAGADPTAVRALPDARGRPNRVVVQRGDVVDIGGGSILQLLRLAGAEPVEVGAVDRCGPDELRAALAGATAGLFVWRAAAPAGLVDLPGFAWACRAAGSACVVALRGPAVTVAAALDAGARLVVADAAEALGGGPPLGLVAGAAPPVRACRAQAEGVGRVALPRAGEVERLLAGLPQGGFELPGPTHAVTATPPTAGTGHG